MATEDKSLFGSFLDKFKLSKDENKELQNSNKIATDRSDGAIEIDDAINQYLLNSDFSYNNQAEMIQQYRDIANYSVVDYAIEDIVNEMVSFAEEEDPVKMDLSGLEDKFSENIRNKIYEKWDKIYDILDLKNTIHQRARQFYIDGRLAYQKVIDTKRPGNGLDDCVELDVRYVKKIRQKEYNENNTIKSIEEFFIYDEDTITSQKKNKLNQKYKEALKIDPDVITYVTSGLVNQKSGDVVSWLHKAVKPANQLRMMENALVVYRISRAPERRVFYVDVSNMPSNKAQQYIRNLQSGYKNKMSFDSESGSFKDSRHLQVMQEDFWLPRNSNGRGTEVSTLPSGQNLGDIEDVVYFKQQLYRALNIPISRLEQDGATLLSGNRGDDISRDELKFSKYISKIRKRFNELFLDLLKTELILTKVITLKEWEKMKNDIVFIYAQDAYLEESRKFEIQRNRLDLLRDMKEYAGMYYSHDYIRRNILQQTEEDMKKEDKQIKKEESIEQYNKDNGGFM